MFGVFVVPAAHMPLLLLAGLLALPRGDERRTPLASTATAPSSWSGAWLMDRRTHIVSSSGAAAALLVSDGAGAATFDDPSEWDGHRDRDRDRDEDWTVSLPLEPCGGGALCVRISALAVASSSAGRTTPFSPRRRSAPASAFRVYRLIVDTGSPYLVVPEGDDEGDLIDIASPVDPHWWWTSPLVSLLERRGGVTGPSDDEARSDLVFFEDEPSYPPTEEVYGSRSGSIRWRRANIAFPRDYASRLIGSALPESEPQPPFRDGDERTPRSVVPGDDACCDEGRRLIVGVMDEDLTREAGGSLLGLIKRSNPNADSSKVQLRPTFLEQERITASPPAAASTSSASEEPPTTSSIPISSFSIDGPRRVLTLSGEKLIPENADGVDVLPLVDLRPLGDFVDHYACLVDELAFDSGAVTFKGGDDLYGWWSEKGRNGRRRRPVVAVFDTGLTGCLLTRSLWDELERRASASDDGGGGWIHPSRVTSLEVRIRTEYGEDRRRGKIARHRDHTRFPDGLSMGGEGRKGMKTGRRVLREDIGGDGDAAQQRGGSECVSIVGGRGVPTSSLFYLSPIDLDWFDEDDSRAPHVVVLGQAFLAGGALTIDADDGRATFRVP